MQSKEASPKRSCASCWPARRSAAASTCTPLGLAEEARRQHDELKKLNHQQIKEIVRRQALLVRFNPGLALETLPKLCRPRQIATRSFNLSRPQTSRADNVRTRMASCAVAALFAKANRLSQPIAA